MDLRYVSDFFKIFKIVRESSILPIRDFILKGQNGGYAAPTYMLNS